MSYNNNYKPSEMADAIRGISKIPGESGNSNYVETITGTLANPLPDGGWSALKADILAGNATANGVLTIGDASGAFAVVPTVNLNNVYGVASQLRYSLSVSSAATFTWNNDGILTVAYILQNGELTEISNTGSSIPTTLTIIHHPLPDTP